MHIRDRNTQSNYSLLDNDIESVDQDEDLDVIISKDLKFTKQYKSKKESPETNRIQKKTI